MVIYRLPERLYLLRDLETFILISRERHRRIFVPREIWRMKKMRHMEISGELEFEEFFSWAAICFNSIVMHLFLSCLESYFRASSLHHLEASLLRAGAFLCFISVPVILVLTSAVSWLNQKFHVPRLLLHLQTISHLSASGSVKDILARTPNLRKVGFHLTLPSNTEQISFPDLASLKLLESVKFEYQTLGMMSIDLLRLDKFPPNLKKLTLIGSHVNWEQMSILAMLPYLEVLKVKDNFFSGPRWETSEDGFRSLRFLKLSHVNLQEWITSECHFPKLEQLVLNACLDLVEIPAAIGDICTLLVIKVCGSSSSAADSAWKIREAQRDWGNDLLKVFIYPNMKGTFEYRRINNIAVKSCREKHAIGEQAPHSGFTKKVLDWGKESESKGKLKLKKETIFLLTCIHLALYQELLATECSSPKFSIMRDVAGLVALCMYFRLLLETSTRNIYAQLLKNEVKAVSRILHQP